MEAYDVNSQSFVKAKERRLSSDKSFKVISLTNQKAEGLFSSFLALPDNDIFSAKSWKVVPDPYDYVLEDGTKAGREENITLALVTSGDIGEIVYSARATSLGWRSKEIEMEFFLEDAAGAPLWNNTSWQNLSFQCGDRGRRFTLTARFPPDLFDRVEGFSIEAPTSWWYRC